MYFGMSKVPKTDTETDDIGNDALIIVIYLINQYRLQLFFALA